MVATVRSDTLRWISALEMTGVIGEEDFERAIEMISKEVSQGPPKKTLGEFRPRQRSYSE